MSLSHSQFSQGPLRISIDPFPREDSNASDESCYSPLSYNSTRMDASPTVPPLCIICSVLCLHDFETDDPDQLKFNRNEILDVVKQEDSGWWAAMRRDEMHVGWIPRTFVEPLSDGMADKLRNVREQLRIYEYEAEVLYHSAAVSAPYQLYYSVPSPSAVSEDWDPLKDGDRVRIFHSRSLVVRPPSNSLRPSSWLSQQTS
jgi:son of sevenless-like protein